MFVDSCFCDPVVNSVQSCNHPSVTLFLKNLLMSCNSFKNLPGSAQACPAQPSQTNMRCLQAFSDTLAHCINQWEAARSQTCEFGPIRDELVCWMLQNTQECCIACLQEGPRCSRWGKVSMGLGLRAALYTIYCYTVQRGLVGPLMWLVLHSAAVWE